MQFIELNRRYERWLHDEMAVWDEDLARKHDRMREGVFPFMRATFFRFAERFAVLCPELHDAPRLLAVGDVHVENFGTWRDTEGRLVWGLNDFDEAATMPYVVDLVRLAGSAALTFDGTKGSRAHEDVLDALLDGYTRALAAPGEPFVLGERHRWLRDLAEGELRDPEVFWKKLDRATPITEPPPDEVQTAIASSAPEEGVTFAFARRIAGLGSLGRPRYLATATWRGARIAREAKRLARSAWLFAGPALQARGTSPFRYARIVGRAARAFDPSLRVQGAWVVRRLSPHCSKIELADLPSRHDHARLFQAMGHELANVHRGTPHAAKRVLADLSETRLRELRAATERLVESTAEDFASFAKRGA